MSWTAPRTWVTDEVVTSSLMNTHVRDNELALYHPLALETADRDVASTASELSLWSTTAGGVTVPANAMGTNGAIRVHFVGDYLWNNNAADTVTVRVKFGGSTVLSAWSDVMSGGSLSASRFAWDLAVCVCNRGATNAQVVQSVMNVDIGVNVYDTGTRVRIATSAVNTTVAQTLDVTAQWSAASAGNSIKKFWAQMLLGQN